MTSKRIFLFDTYLDALTMSETLQQITKIIARRKPTQHVVLNAGKINLMKKDPKLRQIVNTCPLINADGQSIVWAARILGHTVPERVAGIDLFLKLVEMAEEKGWRVFYFGAQAETVEKVAEIHQKKYPNLFISGYRNGYFQEEEARQIVDEINQGKPDILFVAFSSPKKEYWIHQHLEELAVPFVMGVGGSFDVVSGKTRRAPKWMQKIGMEWFYRFVQEPRRMFRRYIIGNLQFLWLVLTEMKRKAT